MPKFLSLLLLVTLQHFNCSDSPTGPTVEIAPENMLVVVANFPGPSQGSILQRLVIIDIADPSKYRFLTNDTYLAQEPVFFDNKTKILFGDRKNINHDGSPQFRIYDLETNTIEMVQTTGRGPIFNDTETLFYYFADNPFTGRQMFLYDFGTEKWERYFQFVTGETRPVAFISTDSLLVFTSDSLVTGESAGFYFVNQNREYTSRVNNPNLLTYETGGFLRPAGLFDWNPRNRFIAYSIFGPQKNFSEHIHITNFEGSFDQQLTNGDPLDTSPLWGPDDNTIIFSRARMRKDILLNTTIMIVDITTGVARELVEPAKIGGASGLSSPDY